MKNLILSALTICSALSYGLPLQATTVKKVLVACNGMSGVDKNGHRTALFAMQTSAYIFTTTDDSSQPYGAAVDYVADNSYVGKPVPLSAQKGGEGTRSFNGSGFTLYLSRDSQAAQLMRPNLKLGRLGFFNQTLDLDKCKVGDEAADSIHDKALQEVVKKYIERN